MRHSSTMPLMFAILIMVQGCDRIPTSPATDPAANSTTVKAAGRNPLVRDVDQLEAGVRLAAANSRIEELERKVDALEATPDKLDLDLLTQRVTALEVKANDAGALAPQAALPKEKPGASRSTGKAAARSDNDARRTPASTSTFKLPDLETRVRPATPAEAKAFSPGK